MDETAPDPSPAAPAVVAAARVRVAADAFRVGPPDRHADHGEPRVQLVRENGEIRAIDVTCRCGEVIRIRCEYS